MRQGLTWWVGGVAVVLAGAALAGYAVLVVPQQREGNRQAAAEEAAVAFASAWQAQDSRVWAGVDYAAVTTGLADHVPDDLVTDQGEQQAVWPEVVEVTAVDREQGSGEATATLTVTWPFGEDGWSYESSLPLTQVGGSDGGDDAGSVTAAFSTDGGAWAIEATPRVVQPELADGAVLEVRRTAPERGQVLDRGGAPLIAERPVVAIGVQPSRVSDVGALTSALAGLTGIDAAGLAERIGASGPDQFVPVITLRREDYDPIRDQVRGLDGVVLREETLPLAPTRDFARALLGRSGEATAEVVEASDGRVAAGDVVGLSGLQREYDERLGGSPGFAVVSVLGEQSTGLFAVDPVDGEPLALSLDQRVQQAADQALASATGGNGNASLVAIDVPTGDVLAVANTPAGGSNRALTGTYAPGSTFKSVSTLALLGTGLTPDEVVACPLTATVEGRAFGNVEDSQLGAVPFRTDFARSCNTAFVGLSDRLEPGDLTAAAATVGLGGDWGVGTPAATGDVPVDESDVELAAATIGQGRVLASPLAMAQVAATFADGTWTPPRLVLDPAPAATDAPPAADPGALATVRELMRAVVTEGSAGALLDVPGAPVHAKTGTAQYGTEDPPRTHAWVIGFQEDVAFAVIVEDGSSGGQVAAPVAATFLRLLAD